MSVRFELAVIRPVFSTSTVPSVSETFIVDMRNGVLVTPVPVDPESVVLSVVLLQHELNTRLKNMLRIKIFFFIVNVSK